MKKLAALIIALGLLAGGTALAAPAKPAPAPAPPPQQTATLPADQSPIGGIGVVDADKVMTESPKIKALQNELNAKGREIATQLTELKGTVPSEQFRQKQEAAYSVYLQIKESYDKQINDALTLAMIQVSREKKLSLVLFKSQVAYGGIDITADVINKLR